MKQLLWAAAFAAVVLFPGTAYADGIAFAGVEHGGRGVTTPTQAGFHYVTLPLRKQTVITRVSPEGAVDAYRALPGAWGIPMVAFDGSTAGLSADGRTLVLAQPPIGRMRDVSRFPVVQARNLRLINVVTLKGSFSFDALSPDGSTLYLIEHVSKRDVSQYRVRAYDLESGRLLAEPIRDPKTGEIMHGYPVSRATSDDGRWAYTLYQADEHSFVHALDTVKRAAACVDLPEGTPAEHVSDARLVFGPNGELVVDSHTGGVLAVIDTKTNKLRPERAAVRANEPNGGFSWSLLVGGVAIALALVVAGLGVSGVPPLRAAVAQNGRDESAYGEVWAYLEGELVGNGDRHRNRSREDTRTRS